MQPLTLLLFPQQRKSGNLSYAHEHGTDRSEISNWTLPE
jgi:hypothetical protein